MNSSKALGASTIFPCLYLLEEDSDHGWWWWCRMWPRAEHNSKQKTNPAEKAALTVFTKWPKTGQGVTQETPISYLNEAQETSRRSQAHRCVPFLRAGVLTSEVRDGVASPLDSKGSWQPGRPHPCNTLEINNRLSFLKITYYHFQRKKKKSFHIRGTHLS